MRRVLRGTGLIVAVTGEPGIGRTHLLDEVARSAVAADVQLLRGTGPDVLAEAFGTEVSLPLPGALADRGAGRPLVLLLDDVPTDPATTALLTELARAPRTPGVLVVLAQRASAAPPPWAELADVQLRLEPLDDVEAAPLLAGLSRRRATEVLERSGGNPLLLRLLAAATDPDLPASIVEAIGAEVDALPVAVRRLVRGAAVAGEPVDLALAAAAAGSTEPIDPAQLRATGLFAPGAPLTFRRPVVAEAVYAGAGPAWRLVAHERVAAVLADAGALPVLRAPHMAVCARAGDGDAVTVLVAAAAAEPSAPAAARWYAAALRLQPDAAPGRVELAAAHAVAVGVAGRLGEAQRALRGLVEDGAVLPGAAAAFLAETDRLLGRRAAVRPALLALLPGAGPAAAAQLHLALADSAADTWTAAGVDHTAALDHAVEALVCARRAGDPSLVVAAELATAAGEAGMGRIEVAVQATASVRVVIDGMAPADPVLCLPLLHRLSSLEERLELAGDGARHSRIGIAVAERTGRRHLEVRLRCTLSACLAAQGLLADAATTAEGAHAAGGPVAQDRLRAVTARMQVALAAGDLPAALDASAALLAGRGRLPPQPAVHLAAVRLDAGDARGCLDALAAGGPGLPGLARADRPAAYELLTRASIAAGDLGAALDWATRAELAAAGVALPGRAAQAHRARAEAHLATGNAEQAVTAARAAVELAAARPVDAGRSGVLLGRALVAAGDPAGAGAAVETAHLLLTGSGARRAADEAAQLLRALGRRPAGPTSAVSPATGVATGPPSRADLLSRREREVAELVAAGRTNRQIAAALFLSEKTIETHLGAAFRKLAVRSRTAVAAALHPGWVNRADRADQR